MLQKFYIEKGKQIEFLNSYLLVHWHRLICANNTKKTIPETNQIGVHQVSLIMRMTPAKKRGKASLCNAFTSWFSWNTKELLPTKSTSRTYADSIFQISTSWLNLRGSYATFCGLWWHVMRHNCWDPRKARLGHLLNVHT